MNDDDANFPFEIKIFKGNFEDFPTAYNFQFKTFLKWFMLFMLKWLGKLQQTFQYALWNNWSMSWPKNT